MAVVAWLVVRYTGYGRYVLAIGGNEAASRLAGVRRRGSSCSPTSTSGVLAGLVGLIAMSTTSASDANNAGLGMELDAIAAVAVAGTPLTGGRMTVVGHRGRRRDAQAAAEHPHRARRAPEVAQIIKGAVIVAALWLQRRALSAR